MRQGPEGTCSGAGRALCADGIAQSGRPCSAARIAALLPARSSRPPLVRAQRLMAGSLRRRDARAAAVFHSRAMGATATACACAKEPAALTVYTAARLCVSAFAFVLQLRSQNRNREPGRKSRGWRRNEECRTARAGAGRCLR